MPDDANTSSAPIVASPNKYDSRSKTKRRNAKAKQMLSKKYNNYVANVERKDEVPKDEDPVPEALERMKYMEMDDLYNERQFQNTMVEIIESTRRSTKYAPQQKMKAVMAYLVTSSSQQASDLTGIPIQTIKLWRVESSWWPKALEYARNAKKESLVSKLGEIVDLSHRAVVDRLEHGDVKYDSKLGTTYRLPVSAKDAMLIADKAQDKGLILRGEATNITEKRQTQDSLLRSIADKLEDVLRKADAKVLEGVVISRE